MSLHAYTRYHTSCQNRSAPVAAFSYQQTADSLMGDKYSAKKVSFKL
jgi:hypothetical protein